MKYSALIRTFNSEKTLPLTLASLSRQTIPPAEYIFVDSGSTDATLSSIPVGSIVHKFQGVEFNFAESLNQGLQLASHDFVLIISSHTELVHTGAIEFAHNLLDANPRMAGGYFVHESTLPLRYVTIDRGNFTGFNGLWNTCSLLRRSVLRERSFRPEVFSAEDQEWASWLFREKNGAIARILGTDMKIHNPRKHSPKKRINEYVAVAYYANRQLLGIHNIARIVYDVIRPSRSLGFGERLFNLRLCIMLVACRIRNPRGKSRYF